MTGQNPPLKLFEWLPMVALAAGRKILLGPRVGVALFIALSSKGMTGQGATIDACRLATELGISERQVWRHVEALVDEGWVEQTQKPTRATKGRPGRRARYRLTDPCLNLSDDSDPIRLPEPTVTTSDETPTNHVTEPPANTSHEGPKQPVDNPNRLTFPTESSDIAESENGTLTPIHRSPTRGTSTGTTGAAAARDEIAAARRRAHGGA